LCGACHVRGNQATIDASGGFERHHEQYEDLFNSKHFAITCVTCHDPHASAIYEDPDVNPNQGIIQTCETCHWDKIAGQRVETHAAINVSCTSCHMPLMGKSAAGNLDVFTGDVHSHLFAINPDPDAPQFSEDGSTVQPYLTLSYTCKTCHNGRRGTDKDVEELAEFAMDYHNPPAPTSTPTPEVEE
jgi:hypothetical protein